MVAVAWGLAGAALAWPTAELSDSSSSIIGAMIGSILAASIGSINSKGPPLRVRSKTGVGATLQSHLNLYINLNFIAVGVKLIVALIRCRCHTELVVSSVSENGGRSLKDKPIVSVEKATRS